MRFWLVALYLTAQRGRAQACVEGGELACGDTVFEEVLEISGPPIAQYFYCQDGWATPLEGYQRVWKLDVADAPGAVTVSLTDGPYDWSHVLVLLKGECSNESCVTIDDAVTFVPDPTAEYWVLAHGDDDRTFSFTVSCLPAFDQEEEPAVPMKPAGCGGSGSSFVLLPVLARRRRARMRSNAASTVASSTMASLVEAATRVRAPGASS